MMLAVIYRNLDVLHRVAVYRTLDHRLFHAGLNGGNKLAWYGTADDRTSEFEAFTLGKRLDTQIDFAELTCTACLFFVAVMALGVAPDGLAISDRP